jgi:diguanylate cyclase (GGDEF)-like protein
VLQLVSQRLTGCVREEDTVARIGGDEFVFVLSRVESADHTRGVAQKILDAVSQELNVEGCDIYLSGSIGISVYPFDGDATERLMKNADAAMYKAKESGKNSFRFFGEVDALLP